MKIRISFDGNAFTDALEIDQRNDIEAELLRRELGDSHGGITGPGVTSLDFEFADTDEYNARKQIAEVFAKIAPDATYTLEHTNYPPRAEDFKQ